MLVYMVSGLLLQCVVSAPPLKDLVYPKFIESREGSSEEAHGKLLYVRDGLILKLTKSSVLSERMLFVHQKDGTESRILMDGTELEKNIYHDREHGSSVSVRHQEGGLEIEGILSGELRIKPLANFPSLKDGSIPHSIYEVDAPEDSDSELSDTITLGSTKRIISTSDKDENVAARALLTNVTLELFILSDVEHHRGFATREALITYLAILINSVNGIFSALHDPFVNFVVVGMMKLEVGNNLTEFYGSHILAQPTLNRMIYYLTMNRDVAKTDVLFLFTGTYMLMSRSNTRGGLKGLASFAGACQYDRVGMGMDIGWRFAGLQTTCHELGHLVGSTHDGEQPNRRVPGNTGGMQCPFGNGFIMGKEYRDYRTFMFSDCSRFQISLFMRTLNTACLHVNSSSVFSNISSKEPAEVVSKHQWCKTHVSEAAFYKLDSHSEYYCRLQCCEQQQGNSALSCRELPMLDGMACGQQTVCRVGVCG